MENIIRYAQDHMGMTDDELNDIVEDSIRKITAEKNLHKVLLLPPDYTRVFSGVGKITALYYKKLKILCDEVDVLPALGTHDAMTDQEIEIMFEGAFASDRVIKHNWREDVVQIGKIPESIIHELSEGFFCEPVDVEVNFHILDPSYDLIISLGQVVPHEVAGMANYSKNIFVGCGGASMISKTHMLGALYGVDNVMGKENSPVRKVFDYAEEHFLKNIPILYVLTVSSQNEDRNGIQGIFIGRNRRVFENASCLSANENIIHMDKPVKKIVAFMDKDEYKSTWVANKAIYRSKLALKQGGELIVIAPGVRKFGEDSENDRLIRRFGYVNSSCIQKYIQDDGPLSKHLSVAAHLIQGCVGDNFQVTYAVDQISKQEIEAVGYGYMPLQDAIELFDPENKETGYYYENSGEEYYFIRHPAAGLWIADT